MNTDELIIRAEEADDGESYIVDGLGTKIKIIRKCGDPDAGYVSSVLVEDEADGGRQVNIAGGTELLPFRKELHNSNRKGSSDNHSQQSNKEDTMGMKAKIKTKAPRVKASVPRSEIIDRELLKYNGKEPDWNAIATTVIKEKAAPGDKRASIISQSKIRHNWYKKGLKKNPAEVKPAANKK